MTTAKQMEEAEAGTTPVVEQPDLNVQRVPSKDAPAAKAPSDQQTVDVYDVIIERSNNEKIATEVFGFEVPILEALHGEQAVQFVGVDLDTDIADVEPSYQATLDGDANSILRMLQGKYNSPVSGDVVSRVYRDANELSEKAGLVKGKGKLKGPKLSEQSDARKKPK